MKLFDTHCHIHEIVAETHDGRGSHGGGNSMNGRWVAAGKTDPDQVIAEAAAAGVNGLICVGCTVPDSALAVDFVQNRKSVWASIGIHPHEAKHYADNPKDLEKLASLATKAKVVAVGECGLDYFYEHSPKEAQERVLRFQIELALKYKLPMIFHVREAFEDFWPIFDQYKGIRGVLHSFTDNAENLQKALDRGLHIGVNGIATFTKNDTQLQVYKSIPLQNLLLETDAPFLTPVPLRGKVNVPANVSLVAEFLAVLSGSESVEDLAEATTFNARKLFSIN
jgi:TatD DNase family protein